MMDILQICCSISVMWGILQQNRSDECAVKTSNGIKDEYKNSNQKNIYLFYFYLFFVMIKTLV